MTAGTQLIESPWLEVLSESAEPLSQKDLDAKRGGAKRGAAKKLKAELEAALADGKVFAVAPAAGRSVRYATRDPLQECKEKILAVLAESPKPLTAKDVLQKLMEMPGVVFPPPADRLEAFLADRVAAAELFEHFTGRSKKKAYATEAAPPSAEQRAEKLIKVLDSQRRISAYPLAVSTWAELTETTVGNTDFKKLIKAGSSLRQRVEVFGKGDAAIVFFVEDFSRIASQSLLEILVRATRTKSSPFTTLAKMSTKLPDERRDDFKRAVTNAKTQDTLSPNVGWIEDGKTEKFFLVADLGSPAMRRRLSDQNPSPRTTVAEPASATRAPAQGFANEFVAAFDRLDRAGGNLNFVSLLDLRRELPSYSRAAFDEGVEHLRKEQRFSLRRPEGRHGISPAERDASIFEAGSQFLYVERN